MLKITSVPTSPKILSRDGGILKATFIIILGCITFSVTTEFTFFFLSVSEFLNFTRWLSYPIAFVTTCFLIYLIEAKGIEFLKYVIDCILHKRVKEDVWLFIFSFLITAVCYAASYFISISGVPSISDKFVEAPILSKTSEVDSTFNIERKFILSNYSSDSLLIEQNYNNQITTLKNEYQSKIDKIQTGIDNLKRKEQRTGKSFTTSTNRALGKIADQENTRENKIGQLQVEKGNELSGLRKDKNSKLEAAVALHRIEQGDIKNRNFEKENDYKSELDSTKNGMGNGILISIPLLWFCVFIQRRIYQKSGITENHEFDDYFYREAVTAKLVYLIRVKFLSFTHSRLDAKLEKITLDDYAPSTNKVFKRNGKTVYVDPFKLNESQMNLTATFSSRTATVKHIPSTQSVVAELGDVILCKMDGCNNSFKPFPKSKKYCSKQCRMKHHKFELKK